MALIYCRKCGARISEYAPKCPKCGAEQNVQTTQIFSNENVGTAQKKSNKSNKNKSNNVIKWSIVCIVVVLVGVFGYLLYSNLDNNDINGHEYEALLAEAQNFKDTLSSDYTILAEIIDTAVAKIYYSSYFSGMIGNYDYDIHVYDIHERVSKIVDFEIEPNDYDVSSGLGHGIIDYFYYNGKIFFDVRCLSTPAITAIKYIDIYTDKIIDFSDGYIDKLENGKLYTKWTIIYYDDKKNIDRDGERYIDLGEVEFSYNL